MSDRLELFKDKFSTLAKDASAQNSAALFRLADTGYPIKEEDWKYTKLNSLVDFLVQKQELSNFKTDETSFLDFSENLIFSNGIITANTINSAKITESNFESSQDFVSDLNLGLNQRQYSIDLDKDCEIAIAFSASEIISVPRLKVIVNSNSAIIINLKGISAEYFSNYLLDLELKANSKLKIVIIQEDSLNSFSFSTINATLAEKSLLEIYSFNLGAKLIRNNISITLAGEKSDAKLFGLNILNDKQHIDNHTVLDHAVPNCESTEIYKGVYAGSSKGIFDGTIIVRKDAQKTNAIQKNQSLLLSKDASSNAKPQLKIWADDVKCTHGATVGQLDENALFYLQARGIPQQQAKAMLIEAFCSDISAGIENESLKRYLQEAISNKLSK